MLLEYKPLFCVSTWSLFDLCQKYFSVIQSTLVCTKKRPPKHIPFSWRIPLRMRSTEAFSNWWELYSHLNVWKRSRLVRSQRLVSLALCCQVKRCDTVVIRSPLWFGNLVWHCSEGTVVLGAGRAALHIVLVCSKYQITSWPNSNESIQWKDRKYKWDF